MNWEQLLSDQRAEPMEKGDTSPFLSDYTRIIRSASFRRLQDKTQVFPLDKSDFIRTRLTHSLEVSAIARSLGRKVGEGVFISRKDPSFTEKMVTDITEILECAGLIHDIGNPPFGHFGEEAIREWFVRHLPHLSYEGTPVTSILTPEMTEDFLHFEGNAQGFRLVSRLHVQENRKGLNLTSALLASMVKYPNGSEVFAGGMGSKMGYFQAEKDLFNALEETCGLYGARHPLVFLLEAADDIAYATADIEDAFKKGFFDYAVFLDELRRRNVSSAYLKMLRGFWGDAREKKYRNPGEYAVMNFLAAVQDILIEAAKETFLADYDAIMAGKRRDALLVKSREAVLLEALKRIAYDYAFTSMSIYKTEIAANNIITYLLNKMVPAVLSYDRLKPPGLMEEKFLSLVSENYLEVYRWTTEGMSDREKVYYRMLLATDVISGMTDSYARDLYTDLNGITS